MTRTEWLQALIAETCRTLSPRIPALMDRSIVAAESVDLTSALIGAFIGEQYRLGRSYDDIALQVSKLPGISHNVDVGQIATEPVWEACDQIRLLGVPIYRPWDTWILYTSLLQLYVAQRLTLVGSTMLRQELSNLWQVDDADIDDLLSFPVRADDIAVPRIESDLNPTREFDLKVLFSASPTRETLNAAVRERPNVIRERPDLVALTRGIEKADVLLDRADHKTFANSAQRYRWLDIATHANRTYADILQSLTLLEQLICYSEPREERLLREYVRDSFHVFEPIPSYWGLPDIAANEAIIPPWVEDLVYAHGRRSVVGSVGALPYWLVVILDRECQPRFDEVISATTGRRQGRTAEFLVSAAATQDREWRFTYDLTHPFEESAFLLLVAWSGVRLTIVTLDSNGHLAFGGSGWVPLEVPDRSKMLGNLIVRATEGRLREARDSDLSHWRLSPGTRRFARNEIAKAEALTMDAAGRVAAADRRWLREQADIARHYCVAELNGEPFTPSTLSSAPRRPQRPAATASEQDPVEDLNRTVACLETDKRALVHLEFTGGDFWAAWCAKSSLTVPLPTTLRPANEDYVCGQIHLPDVRLQSLMTKTDDWLRRGDSPSLRAVLREVGRTVAEPIATELFRLGVRHVVLSPTWFLGLLPIHAAPISLLGRRGVAMDAFDSFTYVPSGRLLQQIVGRGPKALDDIVSFGYDPFRLSGPNYPEVEAGAVGAAWGVKAVLGKNAGPQRVLRRRKLPSVIHLSSHGYWEFSNDYWSGLLLYGDRVGAGLLTMADVLADGSFGDVGLAVLSACRSGVDLQSERRIQDYRGIDSAFLAKGARATIASQWNVEYKAALLFMTILHSELANGSSILASYHTAVSTLRQTHEGLRGLKPSAASALDRAFPEWRAVLLGEDFSDPWFWAGFRCSGWAWQGSADTLPSV